MSERPLTTRVIGAGDETNPSERHARDFLGGADHGPDDVVGLAIGAPVTWKRRLDTYGRPISLACLRQALGDLPT